MYISEYSEAERRRVLRLNLKSYSFSDFYARQNKKGFLMRKNFPVHIFRRRFSAEKTLIGRFCGEQDGRVKVDLLIRNGASGIEVVGCFTCLLAAFWAGTKRFWLSLAIAAA